MLLRSLGIQGLGSWFVPPRFGLSVTDNHKLDVNVPRISEQVVNRLIVMPGLLVPSPLIAR